MYRDDLDVKPKNFCVSIENSEVSADTDINDTILGSLLRAGVEAFHQSLRLSD